MYNAPLTMTVFEKTKNITCCMVGSGKNLEKRDEGKGLQKGYTLHKSWTHECETEEENERESSV